MDVVTSLKEKIVDAFKVLEKDISSNDVVIENSKSPEHGDYATNVALKFSRLFGARPQEVANKIVEVINKDGISKIEIAGPGFINFFMANESINSQVKKIIEENDSYGRFKKNGKRVNVEFVSANPTGVLHLGHARCAALGDSICRLYDWAGYDVTREYYINDAGSQVFHLGESIRARYRTMLGYPTEIPADGYAGVDVIEIAKKFVDLYGDKFIKEDENSIQFFTDEGMKMELERIVEDLDLFRVKFDVYSSERKVRSDNAVEKTIEELKDYVYEDGGALFLKTTDFLDDKDRAIKKSDGSYTYFMPDITYHMNKLSRNYDYLIDLLGADHHGYINRMKSALMMKGYSKDTLEVELVQVVRLMRNGEEVKMSKRTGNAVSLRELCEECGVDAVRYFFVERNANSHLDFDFDLAKEQSSSNPVFYAQYAHARLSNVLLKAKDAKLDLSCSNLKEKKELDLIKYMLEFPNTIQAASKERNPSRITQYISQLALLIHQFYTECKIYDESNLDLSASRLALCKAAKIVMKNALNVIGVSAPEKM